MNPQTLLVDLVGALEALRAAHEEWAALADAHRMDLLGHRMDAISAGASRLDEKIEAMGPLEDRRMELAFALGRALGLPRAERPPSITELRSVLGEERAAPLVATAAGLREAVQNAVSLAERNRQLAQSGRKVAEASVKALAQVVVRSSSTQAAYDRAGARSSGVAVPVFQRSWKG